MLPPRVVNGKKLRRGYTTGTCAAAAAKGAALLLFKNACPHEVEVSIPAGFSVRLPLCMRRQEMGTACCGVIKDAGDDPDVTHGLMICATARRVAVPGVFLRGGRGVGKVTRPGLPVPPGEPAINPVPRAIIQKEVAEILPPGEGVEITISVPGGEEVARNTMNPRLGITGGISILGTSGIVEPMSEKACKISLLSQVSQAAVLGYFRVVLVPGRQSEKWAVERYGLPSAAVVQMSNFVGYLLEGCVSYGIREAILLGTAGKLLKVAGGIFHTHNRVADARREIMVAHAALAGVGRGVLEHLWQCNTVEEGIKILETAGAGFIFHYLAAHAARRAEEYVRGALRVGVVLLSREGHPLGWDEEALAIGEKLGWKGLQ